MRLKQFQVGEAYHDHVVEEESKLSVVGLGLAGGYQAEDV